MKYFIDTEFIEDAKAIDLISIGIVAEDGREFYAQKRSATFRNASDWVARNVFPSLQHFDMGKAAPTCKDNYGDSVGRVYSACKCSADCPWYDRADFIAMLKKFCDPELYGKPEFWGYYADYDWVVLCQLFGTMMDLPKGWPMYCRDIKQWCDELGNPALPEQGKGEHHALADARWNRQAWDFLSAVAHA